MCWVPACGVCGVAVEPPDGSEVFCASCARVTVGTNAHAEAALREVGGYMARLGIEVALPVTLVLRPRDVLQRRGFFTAEPDIQGVTQYTPSRDPSRPGRIEIGIAAGLPRLYFERVLAHEYGHALLFSTHRLKTPQLVQEGLSEVLAHAYLGSRPASKARRFMQLSIASRGDDIYGNGYRMVADAVQRFGLKEVIEAARSGRLRPS